MVKYANPNQKLYHINFPRKTEEKLQTTLLAKRRKA
jgi:hypothetical protein